MELQSSDVNIPKAAIHRLKAIKSFEYITQKSSR